MHNDALEQRLNDHFDAIETIILSRQDPVTGLLPASTAVNAHGDYTDAWVRDNVYSIMSVWGLAIAYRKHQPGHMRKHLLSQSTVKLMRGLLTSMMRQSDRVEAFKHSRDPLDALHAKYGTSTGLAVVGDDEWGHLQLDATSLFLLMLAQMITSGLRIVYTLDEVNFIQNLVHYISHTYCTPDYGIWERGNKINHGNPEINCSSVGMAKAALEALQGFNLFGNVTAQEAVIHVVPSDIARARFTLNNLLPRESMSKETDAALLSIIGFPAYAIEDASIVERTRAKIIKKLGGRYGCKRFLLDGHQSLLEDSSRLHYEPSELREFEHIECEWPLFFSYLYLDALVRQDGEAAQTWRSRHEPLFVEHDGMRLLPELYIVPEASIAAEKADPGSQDRVPNENIPLVWAQSLYMLSEMIHDNLLDPADIDPLGRRRRIGLQRNTSVLTPLLAENETIRQKLFEMGYETQTIAEVSPIRIIHAAELSHVHELLGRNEKLGLSGRPYAVTRTITSARLHRLAGEEVVTLPYYFDPRSFYFGYDNKLLSEHFLSSMQFLATHWDQPGQPLLPFLIQESMMHEESLPVLTELLGIIKSGVHEGMTIITGPLHQLIRSAGLERIDNLNGHALCDFLHCNAIEPMQPLFSGYLETDLFDVEQIHHLESLDEEDLCDLLFHDSYLRGRIHALRILWGRFGPDYRPCFGENLHHEAERLYGYAAKQNEWGAMRRIADITHTFDDRLEDVLLDILTQQKRLAVGRAYTEKAIFSEPLENRQILEVIYEFCGNSPAENALTQEIILHLGQIIRTDPALFENLLTLRTWYFVQLLVGQISRETGIPLADAYIQLLELAPSELYYRLRQLLMTFGSEVSRLMHAENLHASGVQKMSVLAVPEELDEPSDIKEWRVWREQAGLIGHLPSGFYKKVWYILQHCNALVMGDKYSLISRIGNEETLHATAGEQSFELKIDALLQRIDAPEYRQLNIEVLLYLAEVMDKNRSIFIDDDLVLDVIIGHAVRIAWNDRNHGEEYDDDRGLAWEYFYTLSPTETAKAFSKAFGYLLDRENITA
jgi:phosphorylase kinase alpha/beta subunit